MKRGEAIQGMGGVVRISTGRGPGDSVNCRTLKIHEFFVLALSLV